VTAFHLLKVLLPYSSRYPGKEMNLALSLIPQTAAKQLLICAILKKILLNI
jgi:hypothetical protein